MSRVTHDAILYIGVRVVGLHCKLICKLIVRISNRCILYYGHIYRTCELHVPIYVAYC